MPTSKARIKYRDLSYKINGLFSTCVLFKICYFKYYLGKHGASPNDKAMAKKETTEIDIVSLSVYMCNLSFLLKMNSTTVT